MPEPRDPLLKVLTSLCIRLREAAGDNNSLWFGASGGRYRAPSPRGGRRRSRGLRPGAARRGNRFRGTVRDGRGSFATR
jgi:hypothetical protein